MRIALLASAYHPAVGGVEEFTARLAAHLAARGHAIEVWTGRAGDHHGPSTDVVDGVAVRRLDFPLPRASIKPALGWPGRAARALRELRMAAKAFSPDLVNVHCFSGNGVYGAALSRLTGVPLVVSLHGETVMDDQDIYEHSTTLRAGLRLGLKQASSVTACSQFVLDDAVKRFGCAPGKSQVVFNAVDVHELVTRRPFDVPFDSFVLGLGRLVPKKGFDLLLRAFAGVTTDAGLVIAGLGREQQELQELAAALGIADRVCFPGVLDRGQVAWAMANARVFVMPSRVEPFGIVALEAWRAGVPLLATSHGGPAEFVRDGVDGVLIDPFDRSSFAVVLQGLLDDLDRGRPLAARGQARLPEFTWERVTSSFLEVYANIDHRRRPRPAPPVSS